MNKRQKGALAEASVTKELYKAGAIVSSPDFREVRYDLIADFSGDLYRIQVKSGYKSAKGTLMVELRSRNQDVNSTYSDDDFDALCVYNRYEDECYWLWNNELTGDQISIYTKDWDDLRPNNKAQCRNSDDYLISNRKI